MVIFSIQKQAFRSDSIRISVILPRQKHFTFHCVCDCSSSRFTIRVMTYKVKAQLVETEKLKRCATTHQYSLKGYRDAVITSKISFSRPHSFTFVEMGVGIGVVPCWVCEMVILFFLFMGSIVSFRAFGSQLFAFPECDLVASQATSAIITLQKTILYHQKTFINVKNLTKKTFKSYKKIKTKRGNMTLINDVIRTMFIYTLLSYVQILLLLLLLLLTYLFI